MSITLDGSLGISTPTYNGTVASEYQVPVTGFKNRIINGSMVIDQRNAGASVTPTNGAVTYTLDRYAFYVNQASKLTVQQSTTVPAGFKNSMVITSSSAYSSGASDIFVMFQSIEGLNVSDLGWGAAGASAVTVSFWARSSLTGTHSGALSNAGNSRSYPFTFTISAANTWEYKTIAVAGDTSGTWLTTNSAGITLKFNCGSGTSALGTANAWASADYSGATGSVSLVGTSGATLYITGVQLEKGSTATSFDYRPYGTELSLCQRYYQKTFGDSVAPSTANAMTDPGCASINKPLYNNYAYWGSCFPVNMRANPTLTLYNIATGATASVRNTSSATNAAITGYSATTSRVSNIQSSGGQFVSADTLLFHYTVEAEL